MRTEKIDANRLQSYYNCIPEPYIQPVLENKLRAAGGLFSDMQKGAVVWQETEEGKGVLKSLYVQPEARRLGIGSMLLKPLKGRVFTFSYEATRDRASLEPFFDNNNIFYERYDYPIGRITLNDAMKALYEKNVDKAAPVGMYYDELLKDEKTVARKWLDELCEESLTDYTSLNPSSVFVVEGDKVHNALLLSRVERGNLGVDYVFSVRGEETKVAGMMKKAMTLLTRQFRGDAELTMMMTTERGSAMYTKLFGEPTGSVPIISGTIDGDEVWEEEWD